MSNDLNQCNFIGRLGKDVELRYAPSGEPVASFSIACGSQRKNKQGEKIDSTEWINITAFGNLAEICGKYLKKGSQIYLSGRMNTSKYTDKEGVEKYSTKIIAERMQMLGSKPAAVEQAKDEPKSDAPGFDDQDIPF